MQVEIGMEAAEMTEQERIEMENESQERWERREFDALMKRTGNV